MWCRLRTFPVINIFIVANPVDSPELPFSCPALVDQNTKYTFR